MLRIAHLINPVRVGPKSDLYTAQPLTFESMRRARAQAEAKGKISVELLSTQYPEDHEILPEGFRHLPDLTRSVLDVGSFGTVRKFPLIGDLLEALYRHSDAEYLIFTNVDIGVQPHFYEKVAEFIQSGHDAFIINRRRIPDHFTDISQLEAVYAEKGKSHPGFDCFVFHRSLFPKFELAAVCVGIPYIGILTAQNLFAFGKNFRLFDEEFLTFHIGMEVFKHRDGEYFRHNRREFWKAIERLRPHLDTKKWPYYHPFLPVRLWRWGLHPSLPIRLALQLEFGRK